MAENGYHECATAMIPFCKNKRPCHKIFREAFFKARQQRRRPTMSFWGDDGPVNFFDDLGEGDLLEEENEDAEVRSSFFLHVKQC